MDRGFGGTGGLQGEQGWFWWGDGVLERGAEASSKGRVEVLKGKGGCPEGRQGVSEGENWGDVRNGGRAGSREESSRGGFSRAGVLEGGQQVSLKEGPWGPHSKRRKGRVLTDQGEFLEAESGRALKGRVCRVLGVGRKVLEAGGPRRTDPSLRRPSRPRKHWQEAGCEQQGGRRVLLRADFARAASRLPSGPHFSASFPSTSPREGDASAPASSQRRPRLPAASRPLAPRSSPSRRTRAAAPHLADGHPSPERACFA